MFNLNLNLFVLNLMQSYTHGLFNLNATGTTKNQRRPFKEFEKTVETGQSPTYPQIDQNVTVSLTVI